MSHKKLRSEKNCLNCGHHVEDRYCTQCGQENLELDDSAFHLALHYIKDLFHYDGKFWHTLKSLLTRPGLVAKEYLEGKRQRHLEPVRYYVFASTVFFIVFFFVIKGESGENQEDPSRNYDKRLYLLKQEKEFMKGTADTVCINQLLTTIKIQSGDTLKPIIDTSHQEGNIEFTIGDVGDIPKDSMNFMERMVTRVDEWTAEMEREHEGDSNKISNAFVEEILHDFPQLIFLSLPFFAFFLKVLYWRSRKNNLAQHFIFSIYHYAFLFTIILCFVLVGWFLEKLPGSFSETLLSWVIAPMVLYPFVYLYLSMRRFYEDRGFKLIIRYLILIFLLGMTLLTLFVVLAIMAILI
jgi:hypothetical protein